MSSERHLHHNPTLREKLANIWPRLYELLLDLIFYLPCGGEDHFRKKCVNFASLAEGDRVLDLCCGTGTLTSLIAGHAGPGGQVIGVDISEPALEIAMTRTPGLPVTFLKTGAENLPFTPSRFDKCFISFGLHHMTGQARQNALEEARRVLRAGGSLFIIDYNLPDGTLARLMTRAFVKLDRSEEVYKMLVNHSLLTEVQRAGFEIRRRELTGRGMVQLLEAVNTHYGGPHPPGVIP